MLAAMPGGPALLASNGAAVCGWSGRVGGGAHETSNICLAMDGEIFNFDELACEFRPPPETDVELISALYARHGFEGMLSRLNGDFAIVLFEKGAAGFGLDAIGLASSRFTMRLMEGERVVHRSRWAFSGCRE